MPGRVVLAGFGGPEGGGEYLDAPRFWPTLEVVAYDRLPLDTGEKRALFQTNAEQVFGLDSAAG